MWEDHIVQEVRAIREAHAQQYNYDLRAIFNALKVEEQRSGREVITLPPKRYVLPTKSSAQASELSA